MKTKNNITIKSIILCLSIMFFSNANAQSNITVESINSVEKYPIEFHGFISQGFTKSTENNYLNRSVLGSFQFTEVGFNATKKLSDEFNIGFQLFSRDVGRNGSFDAKFDWLYADYYWKDELSIRFGRIKIPLGLYNEYNDVDSGRTSILLPQSIYPFSSRDFLLAHSGFEIYGNVSLGQYGSIEHRLYSGYLHIDIPSYQASTITSFDAPYLFGARFMWEPPVEGIKTGISLQKLKFDFDYAIANSKVAINMPANLALFSFEYELKKVRFALEYGQWDVDIQSSNDSLVSSSHATSERYYFSLRYQISDSFTPGVYYSEKYSDKDDRDGIDKYQKDLAMYARYDINANWLMKLELHKIQGTSDLEPYLNDNKDKSSLNENWNFLVLKTTAYF